MNAAGVWPEAGTARRMRVRTVVPALVLVVFTGVHAAAQSSVAELNDAGWAALDQAKRIRAVFDGEHGVTGGYERGPVQIAKRTIVFDDENRRRPAGGEHRRQSIELCTSRS